MKITKLLLSFIAAAFLLTGCEEVSTSQKTYSESLCNTGNSDDDPFKDAREVYLDIRDPRKLIVEQPHVDGGEASIHFKAGQTVYFKTSIPPIRSEMIVLINDKRSGYSYSSSNDYYEFEFTMPSVDTRLELYYRGDDSHVNEQMNLKDRYTWINNIKEKDITKVITSNKHGTVTPRLDVLDEYFYSDSADDIHRVYEYLKTTKIVFDYPNVPVGAGPDVLTIEVLNSTTQKEERYSIYAYYGTITTDETSLSAALPKMSNHYGYSFLSHMFYGLKVTSIDGTVDYTNDFNKLGMFTNMIFEKLENANFDTAINKYNKYKITCYEGSIVFQSETEFVVQPEDGEIAAYQIVNNVTFKELIV